MGLPKIIINFIEKGVSAIQRSGRGVVALIIADDAGASATYNQLMDVGDDFTGKNLKYIQHVFKGNPSKVIVEVVNETTPDISAALNALRNKRFDYLAYPEVETDDKVTLVNFIESENENDRGFKAVLANEAADSEVIINLTTTGITVGDDLFTPEEYTARIAGIFAGLDLSRSGTFYVLGEVDAVDAIGDEDAAIDKGELILIDDGEKIKIGRAVNSLVTTTEQMGESYKKIKIVEGMHLVRGDIKNTFADEYVGKYVNDYDNKVLFTNAINAYFREMEKSFVLDGSAENLAEVSLEGQRLYIEGKGISTEKMSEQQVKEYNTGSSVILDGNVKFVDAIEDLDFRIHI